MLDIVTDCTTGVGTGELLGVRLPVGNQFSPRAHTVHRPCEVCGGGGFDPQF